MKKHSLVLAFATVFTLAACGGGSDEPKIDNTTKPIEVGQQDNAVYAVNQIAERNDSTSLQQLSQGKVNYGDYQFKQTSNDGKNFGKIEVNGRLLYIPPINSDILIVEPGQILIGAPWIIEKTTLKNGTVIGGYDEHHSINENGTITNLSSYRMYTGALSYARYGIIFDKFSQNGKGGEYEGSITCASNECLQRARFFYQGNPTLDMPTDTAATYNGGAIMQLKDSNYNVYATSSFDVDFTKKTINGTIANFVDSKDNNSHKVAHTLNDIKLNANIKGNTFKGEQMEGKFYGPKAQNMAGLFNDKKQNIQGSFGAEKTNK